MIITQYLIDLPADYDMSIIRQRVSRAADSYDGFPGLGLKAFLIRENGLHGAECNQYAPLYLWPRIDSLWGFVAGPGFDGLARSFGRPSIETWLGLAFARRDPFEPTLLRSVVRNDEPIGRSADLAALRARETEEAARLVASEPHLLLRAVGLNLQTWTLMRADFYAAEQAELPAGLRSFEVLHASAPRFTDLPEG